MGDLARKTNINQGGHVARKGFILTSFQAWGDANRSEDVLAHGPDMDLDARDLTSQEVNDLLLQARSDDSVGLESESIEDDCCLVEHPPTTQLLARFQREDTSARLQHRHKERSLGRLELVLAGMSPDAIENEIAHLEDKLNGLSEARSRLRREARRLAPHNLVEVIDASPHGDRN
jgi:hypothetical protein